MFDVQVRLVVNGRPTGIQEFINGFVQEVARSIRSEFPTLGSLPPPQPIDATTDAQIAQRSKPLAVGMNEAAKMLGICPRTLWRCVNERKIRIGRRVLIPMEVLEKVVGAGLRGRDAGDRGSE